MTSVKNHAACCAFGWICNKLKRADVLCTKSSSLSINVPFYIYSRLSIWYFNKKSRCPVQRVHISPLSFLFTYTLVSLYGIVIKREDVLCKEFIPIRYRSFLHTVYSRPSIWYCCKSWFTNNCHGLGLNSRPSDY